MSQFDTTIHPHRRFNPLTKEHILVSPHRTKRPWLGQTEPPQESVLPKYDCACSLCPGNSRSGGETNPDYKGTFTFNNDFPAILHLPVPDVPAPVHPLMTVEPIHGACDVLVFHPRHDFTMAQLSRTDIIGIIDEWTRIYEQRGSETGIEYVQIFENKGAMMGCSNPHPHGQVWSLSTIPTIPAQELRSLKEYAMTAGNKLNTSVGTARKPCLLCEYGHAEMGRPRDEGRVVIFNDHWVVLVPWWATWPFETLLLPHRRHIESISQLDQNEKEAFADILSRISRRYDNLFFCSFAYSMGIHQRPVPPKETALLAAEENEANFAHLHLHFEPPLLRSASVRKFLVGYEMMAEAQRDLTPEQAATRLRECSDVHYLAEID